MRDGTITTLGPSIDELDGRSASTTIEGPDLLDWDAAIDTPPPRPSGSVTVCLEPSGRSRPEPVTDPRAE
jgi:hypothetical protein